MKMNHFALSLIITLLIILFSCKLFDCESTTTEVYGCMDSRAVNYNPNATIDDGTCQYSNIEILGCTDSLATNYNSEATVDDGTCQYPSTDIYGCSNSAATNYNPDATIDDGSCEFCTGESSSSFLLVSKDAGLSWKNICFNIPCSNIVDISVVDTNNIWVCTAPMFNNGHTEAQILHSNNGGYTWSEQYVDYEGEKFFNYIDFFDKFNGIAMGDGKDDIPIFLKTIDGGQNWIRTTSDEIGGWSGSIWNRLDFVDISNGYFYSSGYADNANKLHKTTDSGISWETTNFNDTAAALRFFNQDIGLVSAPNNKLYRTIDGGSTWQMVNPNWDGSSWVFDLAFHPSDYNKIWLSAGNGEVYYSDDFGSTISKQNLSNEAIKIWNFYVGESTVWAAGYWKYQPLFINRDLSGNIWESMQLPLDGNQSIEGIIDGIGNDFIVIPGHYD